MHQANPEVGALAKQFYDFRMLLMNESDRACALMAAAFLDDQLKELLSANFVDDKSVRNRLLDQRGPLATFSSRIDMAYALGLIGKKALYDLNILRKIRNEFAHTAAPLSFEDVKISTWCSQFHLGLGESRRTPRQRFTRNMAILFNATIEGRTKSSRPALATDPNVDATKTEIMKLGNLLKEKTGWDDNPFLVP